MLARRLLERPAGRVLACLLRTTSSARLDAVRRSMSSTLSSHGASSKVEENCRVVAISGGANGIGAGLVSAFLAEGDVVAALDLDQQGLDRLRNDNATYDERLIPVNVDLTNASDVNKTAASILDRFGRIDVLINNAGIQPPASCVPLHELPEEWWHRVLACNLTSYFYLSKAVLPQMLERSKNPQSRKGVILNMGSVQGQQSQKAVPAYAASKGAIASLTRQMAMDYSPHGIRVVSINPGTIDTPLVRSLIEAGGKTMHDAGHVYPLEGRVGTVQEVADVAVFLASEKASFVTGCEVNVDGGIMAKGGWNT